MERDLLDLGAIIPESYHGIVDIEGDIDGFLQFVDLDGTLIELLLYTCNATERRLLGCCAVRPMSKL